MGATYNSRIFKANTVEELKKQYDILLANKK